MRAVAWGALVLWLLPAPAVAGKATCVSISHTQGQIGVAAFSALKAPKPGRITVVSGRLLGQPLAGAITHDEVSGIAIGFTLWTEGSTCSCWANLDESLTGEGAFFCGSAVPTPITFTPVSCP